MPERLRQLTRTRGQSARRRLRAPATLAARSELICNKLPAMPPTTPHPTLPGPTIRRTVKVPAPAPPPRQPHRPPQDRRRWLPLKHTTRRETRAAAPIQVRPRRNCRNASRRYQVRAGQYNGQRLCHIERHRFAEGKDVISCRLKNNCSRGGVIRQIGHLYRSKRLPAPDVGRSSDPARPGRGSSTTAHQATTAALPTAAATTTVTTSPQTESPGKTTPSTGQAVVLSAAQSAATQVTLVTANIAIPTIKETQAATTTTEEPTSAAGGSPTVLDTVSAAAQALQATFAQGTDPAHLRRPAASPRPVTSACRPQRPTRKPGSTTVVAPQQAVADAAAVATTAATIVAATVATTVGTTEEKTDATATAATNSDTGTTTCAAATSSTTAASQPTTTAATSTVGPGNSVPGNSSAAEPTGDAGGNPIASGVDRVRFVQRVARAFQTVGSNGGSVRLRLSPPELGSVRLEVSVKNGVLTAHVQAETVQARDALVENLPALRERLAEQNIQVDQFDVELFDSSGGGTSNQSQGNGDSSPGFSSPAARAIGGTTTTPAAAVPAAGPQVAGLVDGGLNVVI